MAACAFHPDRLLDSLATCVLIAHEDAEASRRLRYMNAAAEALLGISRNQAIGRRLSELLRDASGLEAVIERALHSSSPCSQRELALHPLYADVELIVDCTVAPYEGAPSTALIEIVDATQHRRITREAALLTQIDGSRLMVRQLAHEIKNPLGGLRGAAQLLARQLPDAAMREYTSVIISEADRLASLVDALLGPGRVPRKEPVNVHELLQHVGHLLAAEGPPGVLIERDYDPSLPALLLDRHLIIQAMLNLGRNALQALASGGHEAGPAGVAASRVAAMEDRHADLASESVMQGETDGRGRIVLRTRALRNVSIGAARHRLVASVQFEDNGPGVPAELRETLFYPLVTGRGGGTGLGLAVAQDLVSRHDGLIEFKSRPGLTTFTILLPFGTCDDSQAA